MKPVEAQEQFKQLGYNILAMISLDQIKSAPYSTLNLLLKQVHKDKFENNDRIVVYSKFPVDIKLLQHLQQTTSKLDISNFFVLLCSPVINPVDLETVRQQFSTDDCVFSSMSVEIDDNFVGSANPLIPLPDSLCYSPWAHMEIMSNGELKPCCVYQESVHNCGTPYNVNTDSIAQVYLSDYMSELRQQFRQGQRPSGCSHCWMLESNGGQSHRQWTTSFLGSAVDNIDLEVDNEKNLISFDIKLGNLCNLKCRICDPKFSSSIAAERIRVLQQQGQEFATIKLLNRQGNWTENSQVWQGLQQLGAQLVNIDFYGGEPFMIPQQETFLDFLIANGYAGAIRLHYNTNGTVYPESLLHKWQQFRHVDIAFSIDNIGARYELERSGATWAQVEHNIDKMFSNRTGNIAMSVYVTVSIQNVLYLPELLAWYDTKGFDTIHLNWLEHPDYLNINNMGSELAEHVLQKIKQSSYADRLTSITSILSNVTNNQLDQFVAYMEQLDQLRNQNFKSSHLELFKLIKKA